jgi:outer membrane immunogenic protein
LVGLLPALAGALTLFAASARAQDFAGPRVEVSAGYGALQSQRRYEDFPKTLEGAHGRAAIGYDARLTERLVLGIEASVGASRGAEVTAMPGNDSFTFRPGRDLDVLGRIGYQLGTRTLVYVKAGWANASVKLVQREFVGNGQYETTTSRADNDGPRLGAGVEHLLTGTVYAKAEYRHTWFGDGYSYLPGTHRDQLLLGAGLRF